MKAQITFSLLFLGTIAMASSNADDKKSATFTDAKQAGKDYQVQGEYLAENADSKLGIQVIALGDRKFSFVAYLGGLPGAGWSRGMETIKGKGGLKDGKLIFRADDPEHQGQGVWEAGKITVTDADGQGFIAKKVHRKSETLGAKPPQGAVVLFDGSSAGTFEKGKLIEKNLLGATSCTSKEKLADHVLHVEFRTPFMPKARGQGRGNSGCYIQSRYECQVLDSFGLEGKDNECGGIYQVSKPAVNMCLPPLAWQTYDIEFTAARYEGGKKTKNARVTIKHNGVVIHDDLELPKETPGCKREGPESLGVFFQDHGNPVAFRNIWAVKK